MSEDPYCGCEKWQLYCTPENCGEKKARQLLHSPTPTRETPNQRFSAHRTVLSVVHHCAAVLTAVPVDFTA